MNQAPVVTTSSTTLTHNQTIAASSLFTATDLDGDPITTFALKDVTGNGHFVVNGVAQATNVEIDLTAAQMAQTTSHAGSGSDQTLDPRLRRHAVERVAVGHGHRPGRSGAGRDDL